MTEQEAKGLCAQLAAEHPDRETHRWVPTQHGDEWAVAKIGLPPAPKLEATPEIPVDERPPRDDPSASEPFGNLPPGWYGV